MAAAQPAGAGSNMGEYANGESKPTAPRKTHITTRRERSFRTALLQASIRPVGSRLIAPKGSPPAHAPELHPPESVFDHCNVRQRNYRGLDVRLYEINARSSQSTRDNFIPAQIHDLKTEQQKRNHASAHDSTEILRQIQTHEEEQVISKDFGSRNELPRKRKHIYYFAGGGWQSPPSKEHWKLCAHFAHTLTAKGHPTTVTLVSHPLAPTSRAQDTLPILERLYYEILPSTPPPSLAPAKSREHLNGHGTHLPIEPGLADGTLSLTRTRTRYIPHTDSVIFAGDSSGGNIALSLVLNVLASNPYAKVPDSLLLVSPAVDLRNTNPDILVAEKMDPLMSKRFIDGTATAWVGAEEEKKRPEFSPLLRDLAILAQRGVVVNGVIGTADVLAPDAQVLMRKCVEQGVRGSWLEWERQMHCFPLAFSYKALPESNQGVEWMVERLMEEGGN